MGLMKLAIGDVVITSLWVFILPFVGVATSIICSLTGIKGGSMAALAITVSVISAVVFAFTGLAAAMGGANFNPSTTIFFYVAGMKPGEGPTSLAVRMPAQALGGILGVMGVLRAMPGRYRPTVRGPSLKTTMVKGAAVEALISFAFCAALVIVMARGPRMMVAKVWLLGASTMALVMAGRDFTGPSMNPANAYGWAYVNNWHHSSELFFVYWMAPLLGATLSAFVFKSLAVPPKHKKA